MDAKTTPLHVLVIGATGNQGNHVARLLLKKGHKVTAFTRNPNYIQAQQLAKIGSAIVKGNLTDRNSLEDAMQGMDAVFAMTTPLEKGIEEEIQQGKTIVDAAKATDCYVVFSSVASANKKTGVPHFESKGMIEQYISNSGLSCAIMAPVYFMENVCTMMLQQLKEGTYASPLSPNCRLAQLALDDLAAFALFLLENQDRFSGRRIEIASDIVTGIQAAAILSRAIGHAITYSQIPMEALRKKSGAMANMYDFFEKEGFSIDTNSLRQEFPEIHWHTYESWAKEQKWENILGLVSSRR